MGGCSLRAELLRLSSSEDHCPEGYCHVAAVEEGYRPSAAAGEECRPSAAVGKGYCPLATVGESYCPIAAVGEGFCPPAAVGEDFSYCSPSNSSSSPCSSPCPLTPRKKVGSSALTWKTLNQRGSYSGRRVGGLSSLKLFPSQVAMWAGVVKLVVGALMAALGGAALAVEAALAPLGGGLWAGAVVGLSGFLAVCAARRPRSQVYTVSLAGVSLLSLSASALLLMLSVAAWAADTGAAPPDFLQQVGLLDLVPPPPTTSPGLSPAVLVSGGLILLAVLDCLVSGVCIGIAARHMCRALGGLASPGGGGRGLSEGHNRKERLYRWLGQQKTIFPIGTATTVASRGPDAGAMSGVASVCQFVPLTESSSTGSLDQLASHDELSVPLSSHCSGVNLQRHAVRTDARNNNRPDGPGDRHFDASLPYLRGTKNIRGGEEAQTPRGDGRFTYLGRVPTSEKQDGKGNVRGGNTFAKYAHLRTNGVHGRYEASGHYDVGPYKNVNSQNPYSRRSLSGKLSQSALYSGNSTLHSTLASSSTQPGKGGLSTTTKNSTGSSQLTTSAYLSSSSESQHAKSTTSSPAKPRPKSTNLNHPNLSHFPSLPHIAPSSSSLVVMVPPPPSSYAQYAPVHQVRRPASERYYSLHQVSSHHQRQQPPPPQASYFHQQPYSTHYAAPQHLQQLQAHSLYYTHQQQPAHSGYYMLQSNAGDQSMCAYQSLPHPRGASHYRHGAPQPYPNSVHPTLYYTHLPAPMMPANYHHLQDYDKRKIKKKKKSRGLHTPVHSSKLNKKLKTVNSSTSKKSKKRRSRELTDQQIDETYTGLDRAIAEGFIGTMMEPAMSSARPVAGYCR